MQFILDVDHRLIKHQQLWRCKVEDKLHVGVSEKEKRFITTAASATVHHNMPLDVPLIRSDPLTTHEVILWKQQRLSRK
jgi:hypothetical protein